MTTQVVVDRSSLTLPDLVIGAMPVANKGIWLAPDGLGRPAKTWARQYATARGWHGGVQVDARLDTSSIPLAVYLAGDTDAAVEALYDELETAMFQFSYLLTVTAGSQSRAWSADCADVSPGEYVSGMVAVHVQRVAITVPVYPIPGVA